MVTADDPLFERAVAAVVEVPGSKVTTLVQATAVLDAMRCLETGGLRLLLIHPDQIVVRRRNERRRWWRRHE